MKIIFTRKALTKFEFIYNHYAGYSEKTAIKISNDIISKIDRLSRFPNMGCIEPLLENQHKEYRYLLSSNGHIKIIYYIEEETIYIATLWDCRQNPTNLSKNI